MTLAPLRLTSPKTKTLKWWRNVYIVTTPAVPDTGQRSPAAKVEEAGEVSGLTRISETFKLMLSVAAFQCLDVPVQKIKNVEALPLYRTASKISPREGLPGEETHAFHLTASVKCFLSSPEPSMGHTVQAACSPIPARG